MHAEIARIISDMTGTPLEMCEAVAKAVLKTLDKSKTCEYTLNSIR